VAAAGYQLPGQPKARIGFDSGTPGPLWHTRPVQVGETRGHNQYTRHHAAEAAGMLATANFDLFDQVMATTGPGPVTCGQMWGGDCPVQVGPPDWEHGAHPAPIRYLHVADDITVPLKELDSMAGSDSAEIRAQAACNRRTPLSTLIRLAQDPEPTVRQQAARNRNTPPAALELLSQDPETAVRIGVAGNLHTMPAVLERLLQDPEDEVAQDAARNQNLPRATLAAWQVAHR